MKSLMPAYKKLGRDKIIELVKHGKTEKEIKETTKKGGQEMIYFVVGLCLGMTIMVIICEKAHKEEVNELRKQIEKDSKNYYDAVTKLEDEIRTQRNVVKALNDDNVRLRKMNRKNEIDKQHDE